MFDYTKIKQNRVWWNSYTCANTLIPKGLRLLNLGEIIETGDYYAAYGEEYLAHVEKGSFLIGAPFTSSRVCFFRPCKEKTKTCK